MKKLLLCALFALGVFGVANLNAGNLSNEEFSEIWNDCLNNENKDSCQRLVDNNSLMSVDRCKKGECYDIGDIYKINENYHQAVLYYKKSCDNFNQGGACYNVGLAHSNGYGVKQDFFIAKKYYEKACNANEAMACNNLGGLYIDGQGVKQNKSMAKKYYGKACDLGFQMGCDNYKILNEQGVK